MNKKIINEEAANPLIGTILMILTVIVLGMVVFVLVSHLGDDSYYYPDHHINSYNEECLEHHNPAKIIENHHNHTQAEKDSEIANSNNWNVTLEQKPEYTRLTATCNW